MVGVNYLDRRAKIIVAHHDPRQGHRRRARWPGQLSVSEREDKEVGITDRHRRAFSVAGPADHAAQGFAARAQLRLSASELQALDRLAALAAQIRAAGYGRRSQTKTGHPVSLLREGDADRANLRTASADTDSRARECRDTLS